MKMIIEGNSQEEICQALLNYKTVLELRSLPEPGTEYQIPVFCTEGIGIRDPVSVRIEDSSYNKDLKGLWTVPNYLWDWSKSDD